MKPSESMTVERAEQRYRDWKAISPNAETVRVIARILEDRDYWRERCDEYRREWESACERERAAHHLLDASRAAAPTREARADA